MPLPDFATLQEVKPSLPDFQSLVPFDNRTEPIDAAQKASRLALFQQHQEEFSSPNESLLYALAGGVGERLQGMGQAALGIPGAIKTVFDAPVRAMGFNPEELGIQPEQAYRMMFGETHVPDTIGETVRQFLTSLVSGASNPTTYAPLAAGPEAGPALFVPGLAEQGAQGVQQVVGAQNAPQAVGGGLNTLASLFFGRQIGEGAARPTQPSGIRPEDFRAGGVGIAKTFGDIPIKTPEVPTTQIGISPPMEKRASRPFDEPKNIGPAPVSQRIQSIVAQLSDLEKVMQERQIVPATASGTAKAEPLGGQVSFASEAGAGAIPNVGQTAVDPNALGKPLPEGWRVTVQQPMFMRPGKEGTSPGGVQIDEVRGGQNIRSTNPQTLREEGYEVPDFSKLPQGQYTSEKAQTLLREKSTAQTTSSFEATRPLPKGGGIAKGQAEKVRPKEGGSVINFLHPDFWKDNLGFAKTAQVEGQQLYNRVRNKLGETSAAFKALDMSGFKAFLATGNKTPEEVQRWVEKNGPRVEVRKFGEGGQTTQQKEAVTFRHSWYDSMAQENQSVADSYVNNVSHPDIQYKQLQRFARLEGLTEPKAKELLDKWVELRDVRGGKNAANWSTVAPKSETDMPGYVEGAVVLHPPTHESIFAKNQKTTLFPSAHSFPENTLGFFRGYMETTPEGKKVFHVIEVQSDWAQRRREIVENKMKQWNVSRERALEILKEVESKHGAGVASDHPLLSQWERLTLRAAIDHAKEQGADAIAISDAETAISDAETAMMTEGHDRQVEREPEDYVNRVFKPAQPMPYGGSIRHPTGKYYVALADEFPGSELIKRPFNEDVTGLSDSVIEFNPYIRRFDTREEAISLVKELFNQERIQGEPKQGKGMRLHYDTTLPRALGELTGSKGERVGFGEHRMAFEQGESHWEEARRNPPHEPRKDLIFHEPSGEPKTSVTAKMFDLGSVPKEETSGFFGGKKPAKASEFRAPGPPKGLQVGVKPKGEVGGGSSPIESALKKAMDWVRSRPEIDTRKWSPIIKPEDMKKELLEGAGNPMETKRATRSLPSASPETTISDRMSMLSDSAKGTFAKAYDMANKGDKVYSPVDVGFDMLDGGKATFDGPLFRNIRWPLDHDFNVELNLTKQNIDPVRELVRKGNLTEKNGQRLGVYAAVQQIGKERMVANGIPAERIDAVVRSMSKAELAVYEAARTRLDTLLPMVIDVAKKVDNIDVQPVDKYFPLQRDWRGMRPEPDELAESRGGKDPMLEDVTDFLTADFTSRGAKPESGFTIERVKGAKTPFKLNFFDVYERHVRDVAHYVSSRQRLAEIAKLVRDEKFQDKYGDFGQKMVMDWLNTYAKQGRSQAAFPQIDWLRKAYARGVLGFRVASQLVHLSNVPLGAQRAGIGWYRRGLANAVSEGGQAWLQKNMAETFARGGGELELLEKQGPITKAAFAPQRFLDRWNAQSTALGIYLRELSKSGKDWRNFQDLPVDQKALAKARVEARRAVASPLYKDLPPALRSQLGKVLLQFQNTFMDQWSNIRYDLPKYLQTDPKRAMGLMTALVGMVLVESGIKYGTKKAEEELTGYHPKSAKDDTYWKKVADESLKRIPGAGQIINAYQFGSSGIPLADVAMETVKGVKQFATAEDSKQKKLAGVQLATAAGEAAGLTGIGYGSQIVQKKMKAEMFKTHNQRLEESAGKPIEKMTMDERMSAEEKLKKETPRMSIGEESKAGQAAVRKIEDRKKELNEAMPKEFKGWAQSRDLRLPGYGDRVKVEGTEIVLTDKEMEHYKKLIQTSDNAIMGELKKDPEFMKSSPDEQRDEFNREIRAGRKNVHTQLIDDLQSGSKIEPNAKKTRRFSFLQEVE